MKSVSESIDIDVRLRRQFGVRTLLLLTAACGVGLAVWRLLGAGADATIDVLLLATLPAAVLLERVFQPAVPRVGEFSRSRIIVGVLVLMAGALVSAAGAGVWVLWAADAAGWFPMLSLAAAVVGLPIGEDLTVWLVPPVIFAGFNIYLIYNATPSPVRLRIPLILALFSALNLIYIAFDLSPAIQNQTARVITWALGLNALAMLGLWGFWLLIRHRARLWQQATLATALNYWMFCLAFPSLGSTLVDTFFQLDLSGWLNAGPAPQVDLDDWAKMRVGLTKQEVISLLGGQGHVSGGGGGTIQFGSDPASKIDEVWQYNWHGDWMLVQTVDPRAYAVWFDAEGKVTSFRGPIEPTEGEESTAEPESVPETGPQDTAP